MKREPGFMGLAKARAKKKPMSPEQMKYLQELGQRNIADQQQELGMQDKMAAYNRLQEAKQSLVEVPKNYQTPEGEMESLAYISPEEAEMLREEGGSGEMTEYGIPSFESKKEKSARRMRDDRREARHQAMSDVTKSTRLSGSRDNTRRIDHAPTARERRISQGRGYSGGGFLNSIGRGPGSGRFNDPASTEGEGREERERQRLRNMQMQNMISPEEREKLRKEKAKEKWDADRKAATEKHEAGRLQRERERHTKGVMRDAEGRTIEDRGVMTDAEGRVEGDEGFDFETATLKGGYDASTAKMDTSGSFEGYKGEYKGLRGESKDLTAGFGEDVTKLGEYQGKFDTMAGEAKTRGDEAATKYENIAGKGAEAATEGATGFKEGAADVGAVKEQFGQEGFQKEAGALQDKMAGLEARTGAMADRGAGYESKLAQMGEQAMSGEVGQEQAEMLKGRMEEQRMASTKGSEEKLRRELAASGASPAEIAAKVAQFQTSSAANQAQAGRSETLQSQIQGQQMGQQQLAQAGGFMQSALGAMNPQMQAQQQLQQQMQGQAGMLGQRAGMAGQQASLGAQQAALKGQAAGMEMQGKQMAMQGVQGGAQLGFQGQQQQAAMLGQGMGAVQAAGGARQQQMAGLDQQGRMIGSQAGMTTAQLSDVVAQQTQQYNKEQAEKQRAADAARHSGGGGGGSGGLLGGVTKLLSDIRLKENIELLEEGKDGNPNIYSFNYKFQPNHRWSGVMAQELLGTKHSDSVKTNSDGYYMVDYHKLGIQMKLLT